MQKVKRIGRMRVASNLRCPVNVALFNHEEEAVIIFSKEVESSFGVFMHLGNIFEFFLGPMVANV